ncbi:TPA: hypothetical protein N0F65_000771 [Lagenidium giganteum]|uniref:Uncharacterized protein n=1 Tax=Lagenidium giganteum TaxID=4803 RepID=A0AAV2ZCB7_9STRA|nr:TPA: hypothetical protein N0F65_000771 [Lagenidium giganteum]
MNWSSFLDYGIVRAIYEQAGVELQLPQGEPMRFINLHLDFMHHYKSTYWAWSVNDHQEDPLQGRFCRTSLHPRMTQLAQELQRFQSSGFPFWGSQVTDYVQE